MTILIPAHLHAYTHTKSRTHTVFVVTHSSLSLFQRVRTQELATKHPVDKLWKLSWSEASLTSTSTRRPKTPSDILLMFQDQQEVPPRTRRSASTPHQSGHRAYVPTTHPSLHRREIAWGNWCCSTSIWHCFGPRLSKWTITHSVCSHSRRSGFVSTFSLTISSISVYVSEEMPSKLKPFLPYQYEDITVLHCWHVTIFMWKRDQVKQL